MDSPQQINRNFTCEICEKKFSSTVSKKKHIKVVHEKKFVCNVCHRSFGQQKDLARHIENNHGAKIHSCKFCSKMFSSHADEEA